MVRLSSADVNEAESPAMFQPINQALRHSKGTHPFLNGRNIIRNTSMFPSIGFNIENVISRIWILVARLAHAAGVNDLAMTVKLPDFTIGWRNSRCIAIFINQFI